MKIENRNLLVAIVVLLLTSFLTACTPSVSVKKEIPDSIAEEIAADEKKRSDLFHRAERTFNEGYMDLALEQFEAFTIEYPSSNVTDDAFFRMGEILLQAGDIEGAIGNYSKIITDFVESDILEEVKYRLALAYFKKGEYNDAIQSLTSLLESHLDKKRKIAVITTIADAHLNLDNSIEALRRYEDALNEEPDEELKGKIKDHISSVFKNRIEPDVQTQVPTLFEGAYVGEYGAYVLIEKMVDNGNYETAKEEIKKFLEMTEREGLTIKGNDLLQVIVERMDVSANTIGCILPLSGKYAPYGKKVLQGVQLAAGIFGDSEGTPINLIIKDSKGEPDEAVKAVAELVEKDKVVAIVGPLISIVAEASAEKAQEFGVPMIALSKKFGVPETGNYIFRNFLTGGHQTKSLAKYVVEELNLKRFAILYPMDFYGEELMHLFWNDITKLGGKVVGIEGYNLDDYDFGKEIKRLVGMNKVNSKREEEKPPEERIKPIVDFDALFIPDNFERAGLIAPQLVFHDVTGVKLLGTNSWNSPKLISIGEGYVEGAIFTSGFYTDSMRTSTVDFTTNFEESFGEKPDTLEAMAYDATKMAVTLIKEGKARSRVEMRNNLFQLENLDGVTGLTSVTDKGDVDKQIFILTVKEGEIVEAKYSEPEKGEEEVLVQEEEPLIK